jgi:hypothetical protein
MQKGSQESHTFAQWTITVGDAERRIARALRICVGNELRKIYADLPSEPIPLKLAKLLHRLD